MLPGDPRHLLCRLFGDHDVACRLETSANWMEIDTPEDFRAAVALFKDTPRTPAGGIPDPGVTPPSSSKPTDQRFFF